MHVLRYYGALVTTAATAQDAFEVVDTADIVLTDIRMPVHDGFWLLEQVRQRPRRIPVIALSAYSDLDIPALRHAGFDGVLRKPVDMHQLVETITALRHGRQ